LDSEDGSLRRVRLEGDQTLGRDALFFYSGWRLRTELARALGCEWRDDGSIVVSSDQATTVDRIYAAGNCADPRALVPTAAGAGGRRRRRGQRAPERRGRRPRRRGVRRARAGRAQPLTDPPGRSQAAPGIRTPRRLEHDRAPARWLAGR
jgi:pyridine nucleotide-disulfide oxidoreductase